MVATDSAGKPISGLQQQDFTILDNNQPQKMTSFDALQGATADPPVEVVLLVDLVNTTSFSRVAYERQEIDKFLRQNNGQLPYPTTLVVFSDTDTEIQPEPSRDGNKMADHLASSNSSLRIIGRSAGVYGAEDRLQVVFYDSGPVDQLRGHEAGPQDGDLDQPRLAAAFRTEYRVQREAAAGFLRLDRRIQQLAAHIAYYAVRC